MSGYVHSIAPDAENRDRDDFYPTPPEATRALLCTEVFDGKIWEPACGDGAISKVLAAWEYHVVSTDLVDYGYGHPGIDFLREEAPRAPNIVTNPPFKLLEPFIRHALTLTTGKVVMLGRLAVLEGIKRKALFESTPIARVHVFSRRLVIGRRGTDFGKGGDSMIAFAWFVWEHGHKGPPTLSWLDWKDTL